MANNGLGKEAVQEITAVFKQLNEALDVTAQKLGVIRKAASMPSSFVKNIKEASEAQNNLANSGKKLNKTIKAKIPTLTQLQALRKKEARLLEKANSLYSKADAKLQKLKKEYRELAIQQQLKGKLDEKEIKRLEFLSRKITKYDAALKKVDAGMGEHRRSVGNYGKAFDSLGFSVAQITRESPAFINSMNTGFMAISNNIPTLVDEINKLRAANVALAAEGKPTVSIMRRLGQAIFSWQSAISAAIVALTVFGPKIVKFFQELGNGNKTLMESDEILSELDETTKQSIGRLQSLVAVAKDVTSAEKDRKDAMKAINDEYDDLLGNLDDENAAYEKLNVTVQDYIDLLIKQAQVKALEEKIGEKTLAIIEARDTQQKLSNKLVENGIKVDQDKIDSILKLDKATRDSTLTETQREMALDQLKVQMSDLDTRTSLYVGSLIAEQVAQDDLADLINTILELNIELNSEEENGLDIKRKKIKALQLESESVNSLVVNIEKQIDFFEKVNALYAEGTEEARFYTAEIAKLKVALGEISALSKEFTDAMGEAGVGTEGMAEGALKVRSILSQANDTNDGGNNDDPFKWKSYFNSLVPLAENTFRIIGQLQKAATDQALADLEKQKDLAIQFAGESTSAREAVEEQYQARRAEIQRKAAENEKRQAIFSTTLNVAQAVVNALTAKPFSLGLAVAVSAIGAAQLALIASQPIPEFAEGVRGFEGGLAVVGDGGRSEVIRTPDGKVMKTPSKDTLVNLPKGSDVFSSEDEFNRELTRMLNMSMINNHQPLISKPELTKEDLSDVISRLEETIRNKESVEIIDDERGRRVYKKRLNARTEILNNRRRIQGKGV